MNATFSQKALDLAVTEYRLLSELGDPVTPAAFGVACTHLQVRLNLSLVHAAELLRLEIDRRTIVDKGEMPLAEQLVSTEAERAETLRRLKGEKPTDKNPGTDYKNK